MSPQHIKRLTNIQLSSVKPSSSFNSLMFYYNYWISFTWLASTGKPESLNKYDGYSPAESQPILHDRAETVPSYIPPFPSFHRPSKPPPYHPCAFRKKPRHLQCIGRYLHRRSAESYMFGRG